MIFLESEFVLRLYLVRHGETVWNFENRIQGASDVPLNKKGREQAQDLANKLQEKIKKAKFDEQREMRNALSGDGGPAYDAADRHRKSWQKNQRNISRLFRFK